MTKPPCPSSAQHELCNMPFKIPLIGFAFLKLSETNKNKGQKTEMKKD
jgi:hypothetical protein